MADNKQNKKQTSKSNNTNRTNDSNPSFLKPFKTSYTIALFLIRASSITLFYIFFNIITGKLCFSLEQVKNIIGFTFNIIFVFAAFIFTIFGLHDEIKSHPQKNKILLDYIGQCLLLIAISISVYISSYVINPTDTFASSILFYVVLTVLWLNLTKLLYIIRYFFNPYK